MQSRISSSGEPGGPPGDDGGGPAGGDVGGPMDGDEGEPKDAGDAGCVWGGGQTCGPVGGQRNRRWGNDERVNLVVVVLDRSGGSRRAGAPRDWREAQEGTMGANRGPAWGGVGADRPGGAIRRRGATRIRGWWTNIMNRRGSRGSRGTVVRRGVWGRWRDAGQECCRRRCRRTLQRGGGRAPAHGRGDLVSYAGRGRLSPSPGRNPSRHRRDLSGLVGGATAVTVAGAAAGAKAGVAAGAAVGAAGRAGTEPGRLLGLCTAPEI